MDREFDGGTDRPGFDWDLDLPDPSDFEPGFEQGRALVPGKDFIDFYGRSWLSLLSYARRLVNDPFEAEEIVQDAFLKVFIAMPELENEGHAMAYLRRTVQNLCIDRYRKNSRRPKLAPITEEHNELEADESGIDPVVAAEDAAVIREALARLKWEHREALVAWEIEGATTAEIAARIGVDEKNVKHTLNRARAALRRLLVGTAVDPEIELTIPEQLSIAGERAKPLATRGSALLLAILCGWLGTTRQWVREDSKPSQSAAALPTIRPTARPSVSPPSVAPIHTTPKPAATTPTHRTPPTTKPNRSATEPSGTGEGTDVVAVAELPVTPSATFAATTSLRALRAPRITGTAYASRPHTAFGKQLRWNYSVMTNSGVIVLRSQIDLTAKGLRWTSQPLFESGGYLLGTGPIDTPLSLTVSQGGVYRFEGEFAVIPAEVSRIQRLPASISQTDQQVPRIFRVTMSVSHDLSRILSQQVSVEY